MIIWIASYPRSGNTFLRVILNSVFGVKTYSIYDDKYDIAVDRDTKEIVGHEMLPGDFDIEAARNEKKLYVIKTHKLPPNNTDKAIYILRDGRESTLSFSKYRQEYETKSGNLQEIIYGNEQMPTWGDHISQWDPQNRENTLLIIFEKLISNPEDYIDAISDFIGIKKNKKYIPSFHELKEINPKFFRSGETSSWKTELSDDEQFAFLMKNYTELVKYGYDDMTESFKNNDDAAFFRALSKENTYMLDVLFKQNGQLKELLNNLKLQRDEILQLIQKMNHEQQRLNNELQRGHEKLEQQNRKLQTQQHMIYEIRRVLKCTLAWYIEKIYTWFQKSVKKQE